jgi:hypothetical protein
MIIRNDRHETAKYFLSLGSTLKHFDEIKEYVKLPANKSENIREAMDEISFEWRGSPCKYAIVVCDVVE